MIQVSPANANETPFPYTVVSYSVLHSPGRVYVCAHVHRTIISEVYVRDVPFLWLGHMLYIYH